MLGCSTLPLICLLLLCKLQEFVPCHAGFERIDLGAAGPQAQSCLDGRVLETRAHNASITDFGGVGDGITLNTDAFHNAISHLKFLAKDGGAQLNIPAGKWLTGSFNLTSHFTLYLEKDAIILGSQNPDDWPLLSPLPSYGRGRERPGRRHMSLIHGEKLFDVVITGDYGIVDGQGSVWWEMWQKHTLEYTRGHLVEFVSSENIILSNVVLINSPFWTVHPVYCNNVVVKGVTILAPNNSPNTDGIDPDSSSNVCIEDCYISNGDDLIALKSGWDEYGIGVGRPSANIIIRRITGTTPAFSGIAFGSEMSGGITDVLVEDVHIFNTSIGIRLKTAPGRGGYITNITITGMTMESVKMAIEFTGDSAEHPDASYDPNALPVIKGIVLQNVVGKNVRSAGRFLGLQEAPFYDICLSQISFNLLTENTWSCSYVKGSSSSVYPTPCPELQSSKSSLACINT